MALLKIPQALLALLKIRPEVKNRRAHFVFSQRTQCSALSPMYLKRFKLSVWKCV